MENRSTIGELRPGNPLRDRLSRGGPTIGLWLTLGHAGAAEIAGGAGFDWCLIDGEHGCNDLPSIQAQLQALAAAGCPALIRVADNDPALIKQAMDVGCPSIMVPMVHDADGARRAARAMRYPPDGMRGMGGSIARSGRWGATANYGATANAQAFCIVQAESAAAVANIDAIAATPGVDGVFIGPSDLAADMGLVGQPGHADVQAAIAHLVARTQAAGKVAGCMTLDPALWPGLKAQGLQMLAVGAESLTLTRALAVLARQARGAMQAG